MPTTWHEMSKESRIAAYELFAAQHWRDFASRAYYAVYCHVTHGLLAAGATMPADQNNPKHRTLPALIVSNLHSLSLPARSRLSGLIAKLYDFRIIADYLPTMTFDETDARICMAVMRHAFDCLKDMP